MQLHILSYDNDEMDVTHDIAPEKWLHDFGVVRSTDGRIVEPDDPRGHSSLRQADILIAVQQVVAIPDDAALSVKEKVISHMEYLCCCHFMQSPEVLHDFDERVAKKQHPFVKVFDDHIEIGWMDSQTADRKKLH
jgi:hypothetical protein